MGTKKSDTSAVIVTSTDVVTPLAIVTSSEEDTMPTSVDNAIASTDEVIASVEEAVMANEQIAIAQAKAMVSEEELITLDQFILGASPNPGLVASFKAEPLNDPVTPRSADQWKIDFDTQANRVYK